MESQLVLNPTYSIQILICIQWYKLVLYYTCMSCLEITDIASEFTQFSDPLLFVSEYMYLFLRHDNLHVQYMYMYRLNIHVGLDS